MSGIRTLRALLWSGLAVAGCKDSQPTQAQQKATLEQKLAGARAGEEREIEPGMFMTMYRMQATERVHDGWEVATSTKGAFSVELPLRFNDFSTRSNADDGVELRADTIGAKSPGLLSWNATCVTRADGKVGSPTKPPVTNKVEPMGSPVRAWQRMIALERRVCVLIVEAQGSDPLPSEEAIQRFLHSFKEVAAG